jgi:integrase/recombinase XerD
MNVHDLLAVFLAYHRAAGHSPATVQWYSDEIERFLAWLVASGLHNGNWLQAAVVERYLAESRTTDGNAPATVATHYRGLKGFFSWLQERSYIATSPMAQLRPPKVPKTEPKRASLAAYLRLLESLSPSTWLGCRDRLIVTTLFLCGIRRGECAHLKADDYRLSEHVLYVDGKTGPRLVPLLPAVEKAYVQYLYNRPAHPSPYLLLGANGAGKPQRELLPGGIYQMLRRHCLAAGVPRLNPHSFRHGLAMLLLNERHADMSLVQKVLGHSQIATTSARYAEWLTAGLIREFSEKMRGIGE